MRSLRQIDHLGNQVPNRLEAGRAKRAIAHRVIDHPANAPFAPQQQLIAAVGEFRGLDELRHEGGRDALVFVESYRKPLRRGDIRRGVRRNVFRVHGHRDAAFEQQSRSRHSDCARSEHRRAFRSRLHHLFHGQRCRAPRERHAAAPVTVVVHHCLLADFFHLHAKSRRTVRPQTRHRANDAIIRHSHLRQ
jgi:hypothetical protein